MSTVSHVDPSTSVSLSSHVKSSRCEPVRLERTDSIDSHPSLSHTSATLSVETGLPATKHEILLTPIDRESDTAGLIEEVEVLRSDLKKGFGRLYMSRSVQGMRDKAKEGKKEKSGSRRARALSASQSEAKSNVIASPRNAASKPVNMPQPAPKPTRPVPTRSGGSFSSFIRRLTGRSSSPPKSKDMSEAQKYVVSTLDQAVDKPLTPLRPTAPVRIPSATVDPTPARIAVTSPLVVAIQPMSAPAAPQATLIVSGPTPIIPPLPESIPPVPDVDPCLIPLPPSPLSSPLLLERPVPTDLSLASPAGTSGPSLKGVKQTGMLSLEGFDFDEEELDSVPEIPLRSLEPLRIPSNGSLPRTSRTGNHPTTPQTASTTNEVLVTPLCDTGSSPERFGEKMMAGSSPPRKAPVGTGTSGLQRKESKWRKSVMGISETLNSKPPRQPPSRPPPTSYDAYKAHQRRIATNRVSCAPTLHSTASIAAEVSGIKDKEEVDMAETFFLS